MTQNCVTRLFGFGKNHEFLLKIRQKSYVGLNKLQNSEVGSKHLQKNICWLKQIFTTQMLAKKKKTDADTKKKKKNITTCCNLIKNTYIMYKIYVMY